MRLRTQLILLFFVLGALPLGGIVSFTYFSSLSAFERAAEAEAAELTEEIGQRLETAADELSVRVAALSRLPFAEATREAQAPGSGFHQRIVHEMGELAPLVEAIEYIPVAPPEAEAPPAPEGPPAAPAAGEAAAAQPLRFELSGEGSVLLSATRAALAEAEAELAAEGEGLGVNLARGVLEGLVAGLEDVEAQAGAAPGETREPPAEGEAEARGAELSEAGRRLAALVERRLVEDEEARAAVRAIGEGWRGIQTIMGRDLGSPVSRDGEVVGLIHADVRLDALLVDVLGRTRRDRGEIPFAIDADGEEVFARPADGLALAGVPLPREDFAGHVAGPERGESWIVVSRREPGADVTLGIARPVRESLAAIQRTAGRNFGYGVGLLAVCVLGILPLTRRVTRSMNDLTVGAERLAAGNLDTQVPVRSRGELGRLARAFNRMSLQLKDHQQQLLAEEKWRQEQTIRERLLQAENARRGQELDEARRFQLSLLPRELPRRADLEVAVSMKTAAEVGGDYYDFHLAEDGTLTVAIGDATGHGARAGTMVTVIKTLFTADAGGEDLVAFLTEASAAVRRMELGRMAMALQLARLNGSTLTVASAGMPPVLVHRRTQGRVDEVALEGVPLGGLERAAYAERRVELGPGDTVLLMSDGFPELLDPEGEPLGYARALAHFQEVAERGAEEIVAALGAAAAEWAGGDHPSDDVTFVVLKLTS